MYLADHAFSHRQLYFARSQVRQSCYIKVKIDQDPQQRILIPKLWQIFYQKKKTGI